MDPIAIAIGFGVLLVVFVAFLLAVRPSQESMLLEEVTSEETHVREGLLPGGLASGLDMEQFAKPLRWLQNLTGRRGDPLLARRLMLAGYRKPYYAEIFLAVKLMVPVVLGVAVAFFVKENVFFWFLLAVGGSFLLPDFWLMRAINHRRECVKLSLPDALDLMAICMEAGLGLDQTIVRVGKELKVSHPQLSEELLHINLAQRAGHPRIGAWRDMADRVDVESVRSFVNMLVQTERFRTPISKALGVFSEALRTQRRQRAEEMAAKTKVKLVLPLVLFIFPSIFIVTVAPAVIIVMKSFSTIL